MDVDDIIIASAFKVDADDILIAFKVMDANTLVEKFKKKN
jgi:hypothetical protein